MPELLPHRQALTQVVPVVVGGAEHESADAGVALSQRRGHAFIIERVEPGIGGFGDLVPGRPHLGN